jgi:hypothetical protein
MACGGGGSGTAAGPGPLATHTYSATASVGDFLTITVNPNSDTIDYTNHTNGRSGTVSYTVGSDGTYNITTPGGGLIKAYEIPGFALVASADNTGSGGTTTSLVTAILQAPISLGWLESKNFNYMQWRTSLGGMGIGTVAIDGSGNASTEGYWPFGAMQVALGVGEDASAWSSNSFSVSDFSVDASGNFLTLTEGQGTDTVFATQGGFFVVDNPNGSIISVPQASSGAFDPGTAGTYKALAFFKNATMGSGSNTETGTGVVDGYTLTLSDAGLLTVTNASGTTVSSQTIQPVSSVPGLMASGTGQLPACPGLFTYSVNSAHNTQVVFLEFIDQAILFCSCSYDPTQTVSNPTYSYFYGVALQQ